jgi:hypothetical protein
LLLDEQLSGVAALIALGIACWPRWPPRAGMLIYSGAVAPIFGLPRFRRRIERRPSVAGSHPSSHTDRSLDARRPASPRSIAFSSEVKSGSREESASNQLRISRAHADIAARCILDRW